ncbi:MAG: DUF2628 domain-containing protein [Clostridia bacterium]|nr:DUF2628 domain-containing protein [Clostridia bacterium]
MNNEEKKLSCGVCHAYLFDDDDVVYCPVCGAPHHRDCYNGLGHCAFEGFHGTENEYKKSVFKDEDKDKKENENRVICEICGAGYGKEKTNCPECGAPNFKSVGGTFAQFDFLGGVPEDTDLGQGVRAAEARRFVFTNTRRYIPKFAQINLGKKAGWNWFSFLFPCGWFLSRKMYKAGIIAGILSICFSMFSIPFQLSLSHYDMASFGGYNELFSTVLADASKIGFSVLALAASGVVLQLILRFICAIFGDKIYRDYAIDTISRIKRESDDIDYDYRKKGGANVFLLLIGFFAVQYIPSVIASLLI